MWLGPFCLDVAAGNAERPRGKDWYQERQGDSKRLDKLRWYLSNAGKIDVPRTPR